MPRIVHFEFPAQNSEKLAAFYKDVFGWEFNKWEGGDQVYWLVKTGEEGTPGIDGGLYTPQNGMSGVINVIDVDNVDAYVNKVKANGGAVFAPKMPIPGVGYLAYCKDVEGTIFGMMQSDPSVTG